MRVYLTLFCAFIMVCGIATGCATNDAAKNSMESLQSQMIEMQKSIADTNLRMEEMSNSIFILQEQAKANKEALKKVSQPKIVILSEDANEQILASPQMDVPMPLPQGGVHTPGYGTDNIKGAVGSIPVSELPSAGQDGFSAALSSYKKQSFGLAIFDFSNYLTKNPRGSHSELALYYLGMSYYKLNEFGQAIREWRKLISAYPQSVRGAEVGYRVGVAYNTLGKRDQAKTYFDLVSQKYPGTEWAKKALSALGQ